MRSKAIIAIMAILIVSGLSVLTVGASSHNDAPLIAEDPMANNTDVYAFVSTEPGRDDHVTLIANYIPMMEPGDGPTFSRFSDQALYDILVDIDGDAKEDITYQFEFENKVVNGNTFLYNTGKIGLPSSPTDPSSQYTNLNVQQSYTLTEIMKGADDDDEDDNHKITLLSNARVAPAHVGPRSTGTATEYELLANAAIHTVGSSPDDMRVFVGPRDEGFYADLMGAFDLLNIRDPGFDTFSGFNVYSIALEIPKSRFAEAGDDDGVIGVWATASRPRVTILKDVGMAPKGAGHAQVSRLGNPLVNEVLMPLDAKDLFNSTEPRKDGENIADFIVNPGSSQGSAALVPLLNGITGCTPENGRSDLALVFLTGIPGGVVPGFAGNFTGTTKADMLRLNYNVPPSTSPNPLGLLGGDVAGYPNGRRVGDDVIDIALKGAAGGVLQALGAIDPSTCSVAPLDLSDNVDSNDVPYLSSFPYLGTPHQGYEHVHSHGGSIPMTTIGIGSGLTASGLVLAGLIAMRRRRNSIMDQ